MVLALPVALFTLVGYYKVWFARNIVAVVPGMAIAGGAAAQAAGSWLASRTGKSWVKNILMVVLFAAGAFQLLPQDIQEARCKNLPDTRWLALSWIRNNIPDGATVAVSPYAPPVGQYDKRLKPINLRSSGWPKVKPEIDYIFMSSRDYGRYFNADGTARKQYSRQANQLQDFFNSHELLHEIAPEKNVSTGPVIMIYRNAPPQAIAVRQPRLSQGCRVP